MGGGNGANRDEVGRLDGLSPRGRGKRARAAHRTHPGKGLSPRGRGKLGVVAVGGVEFGSIPAWAGETITASGANPLRRVYPRVGGGNPVMAHRRPSMGGLSPRGRGKHPGQGSKYLIFGSIPAWAGETTSNQTIDKKTKVYPRVGGGNGNTDSPMPQPKGLSPRGRGKRTRSRPTPPFPGSIPAWAGETAMALKPGAKVAVYPRVGGGNGQCCQGRVFQSGLSPRGRGKQGGPGRVQFCPGSIPAWAGETRWDIWDESSDDGLSPRGRGKPM